MTHYSRLVLVLALAGSGCSQTAGPSSEVDDLESETTKIERRSTPAEPAESSWQNVGNNYVGSMRRSHHVDAESFELTAADSIGFWYRETVQEEDQDVFRRYAYAEVNCRERTIEVDEETIEGRREEFWKQSALEIGSRRIRPDSLDRLIFDYACFDKIMPGIFKSPFRNTTSGSTANRDTFYRPDAIN